MPSRETEDLVREVWKVLATVSDPEIPVISIVDLGIVRDVRWEESKTPPCLVVIVTPTYSGCPATEVIAASIRKALDRGGFGGAVVETRLAPAWTTNWMTPEGREKLRDYGIAPPIGHAEEPEQAIAFSSLRSPQPVDPVVACPQCGAGKTERLSQFGSTPCKALYRCLACREPFDYFKCH